MPLELVSKKIAINVRRNLDTVTIDIVCENDYQAELFYEDVVEKMQKGDDLTLKIGSMKEND